MILQRNPEKGLDMIGMTAEEVHLFVAFLGAGTMKKKEVTIKFSKESKERCKKLLHEIKNSLHYEQN